MIYKFYFSWTNWTIGAWYFRNRLYWHFGIDLGPCQWVWRGKRTR